MPTIEERADYFRDHYGTYRSALIATLTEFEAFRREVSDAASEALAAMVSSVTVAHERAVVGHNTIARFILPKPVDPLVEAVREAMDADNETTVQFTNDLRAALAKRGLKLVEVGDEL